MGQAGRPQKEIPKKEFENLCALQCTQQEICDFFNVDHKTLTKWCKRTYKKEYSQVYQEKRSAGKISLRRAQFRLAERNAAMAIFLGKNVLGQSDYPEIDNTDDIARQANLQVTTIAEQLANAVPSPSIEELLAQADSEPEAGDED